MSATRNCAVCGEEFTVARLRLDMTCGADICDGVIEDRRRRNADSMWARDRRRFVVERCRGHWREAKAAGL